MSTDYIIAMPLLKSLSKYLKILLPIVVVVLIAYYLHSYAHSKNLVTMGMENSEEKPKTDVPGVTENVTSQPYTNHNVAQASELLPSDANANIDGLMAGSSSGVSVPVTTAGYHIGLDTVGQTLRNANQQLRSDPYIQKKDVGLWNQSTIEPDLARVPLELGATA